MDINELSELRKELDNLDQEIIILLAKRFELTEKVGIYKAKNKLEVKDSNREAEQFDRIKNISLKCGLNPDYATIIFKCIIETVISRHNEIKSEVIDN